MCAEQPVLIPHTPIPPDPALLEMIENQIRRRGINDPALLAALRRVPRARFVPSELREHAFEDRPLPIGLGQTISQPYIVALMTDALDLRGDEKALEIGTGSGYQAAVLAELVRTVHSVERHPALAQRASQLLADLGYGNVFVHEGDGSRGWPEQAPFDVIVATAAAPAPPEPLFEQLGEGGRFILPVGPRGGQVLQLWRRRGRALDMEELLAVAFVPLYGHYGWPES